MPLNIRDDDETNEARLIHEIARQVRVSFDRRVKALGLTRSQWYAFGILRRNPEGIRQNTLAYLMEIEPISLVRLLDRMEKSGWIERKADPTDRRANLIVLTKKAKAIIAKMLPISHELRRDTLYGFSNAEHEQLIRFLKRMKTNVANMLAAEEGER